MNEGKIAVQGSVAELRNRRRSDGYIIETEHNALESLFLEVTNK